MLKLEKLAKQYKTGDQALKGVDLEIPKSQVIALIGPSGAGKSTLIRCINRLVEPTSGKVFLNDLELTSLSSRNLKKNRRRMGMIFQEYALVERLTVMENVLSGRLGYVGFWRSYFRKFPQEDIKEAYRLLDRVGLIDMVDKRADELSGGQRQAVAIARATAFNAKIVIMDEPTAALAVKEVGKVLDLILNLKKLGVSVIVISHRMDDIFTVCDRVMALFQGTNFAESELKDTSRDEVIGWIMGKKD